MERKASAVWKGGLKDGKGSISAPGGVLKDTPYSFTSRFENGTGTNPEELIAAAHSACFSMALSAGLGKAGFRPQRVHTTAKVSIDKVGEGFKITKITLVSEAQVPGIDNATFQDIAGKTKAGC